MIEIQIQNYDGELVVDSRIVARGFEIEHESFCKTLQKYFTDSTRLKSDSTGGRPQSYFLLGQRDIMILPAVCKPTIETFSFQTRLVDAFIAMSKALETYTPAVNSSLMQAITDKLKFYEEKIARDASKVQFAEAVSGTEGCISLTTMAQLLHTDARGCGVKRLCQFLRDRGIMRYEGRNQIPYQRYLDQGHFELIERTYTADEVERVSITTRVTGKGQAFIADLWNHKLLAALALSE